MSEFTRYRMLPPAGPRPAKRGLPWTVKTAVVISVAATIGFAIAGHVDGDQPVPPTTTTTTTATTIPAEIGVAVSIVRTPEVGAP